MNCSPEFGKQLKQARKNNKYTQESIAEMLNVSTRWIQYIESGKRMPGKKLMNKIFKIFPELQEQQD